MQLTNLLDVAIGLALVYLGASLFVTVVNEYIAQILQRRSKQLLGDLKTLIDDPGVRTRLAASPALKPFFADSSQREMRSYVDPNVLARLLVGSLGAAQQGPATLAHVVKAIEGLPPSGLKTQLLALSQTIRDDVDMFVQQVATWADKSLTMMGELYKRRTQLISLAVGLVIAVVLNVDTVGLVRHLYVDKEARDATVATAVELVANTQPDGFRTCMDMPRAQRDTTEVCAGVTSLVEGLRQRDDAFGKLPLGWGTRGLLVEGWRGWLLRGVGWVLTALAISLGASFWFDFLNRLVNVRHGMRRPTAKAET